MIIHFISLNIVLVCAYQDKFGTFTRLTDLLNAMGSHDDLNFWQILGDNFYDQAGDASSSWFAALSSGIKSKFFSTVPGNHDFWVNASPEHYVPNDQLGNGFMQFYGQDTVASTQTSGNAPYDFSADPDGANKGSENLPPASNFFFYNKLGNVAFIGYSGARSFESMESYFTEACNWAVSEKPDVLFLLGHWNMGGDGCDTTATVPAVYSEIAALPACAPIASKMLYFMGHKHCNMVTEKDIGFMVGGMGMSDASSCGGVFGIPVVDTTGGSVKVYYFQLAVGGVFDDNAYSNILNCFKANGVSGCYSLATLWSSVPI